MEPYQFATSEDVRVGILRRVVSNFLAAGKSTRRKPLLLEFRDEAALIELDQTSVLKREPTDAFLPSAVAFHFAASEEQMRFVKHSFRVLSKALSELYCADDERTSFPYAEVIDRVTKLDSAATDETIRVGFYFIQEFNLSSGYSLDGAGKIQSFGVDARLALKEDLDAVWDEEIQRRLPQKREPFQPFQFSRPTMNFGADDDSGCLDLNSEFIHPTVREIASSRVPHNLADAVEACLKEFNVRVSKIVRDQTGKEYDGAALMQKAFSVDNPILQLGCLETVDGRNMQVGYQQIFSGAMTGIRNPKAHGNIQITPQRAMQFLALVSLMMEKLDEAIENGKPAEAASAAAPEQTQAI